MDDSKKRKSPKKKSKKRKSNKRKSNKRGRKSMRGGNSCGSHNHANPP